MVNKFSTSKFEPLQRYLERCAQSNITLSFEEIEIIIGTKLCKSAYVYYAYWHPSSMHTLPNMILNSGYKIMSIDLSNRKIILDRI